MRKVLIIGLLFLSAISWGQIGQWDSTQTIIYPTSITGKVPLSATDTIYLIDVLASDSGNSYINRRSKVRMIYDFNQDATDDTIYAATLFPNYDYDSLFYTRISNKTINADSTLLLPQRITEFEVYSSASSSDILVPAAPISTLIVPDNYATLTLAIAAASINDTIIVKSIDLSEGGFINLNKNGVKIIGVGNSRLVNNGASYTLLINGVGNTIENLQIIPPTSGEGIFVNTNKTNTVIKNCYLHDNGTFNIRLSDGSTTDLINNIFNPNNAAPCVYILSDYVNIQDNFFNGTTQFTIRNLSNADSIICKYNYFDSDNTVFENGFNLNKLVFSYNDIVNDASSIILNISDTTNILAKGNTAYINQRFLLQEIEGNVLLQNNSITATTASPIIQAHSCDIDIIGNDLIQNGSGFNILLGLSTSLKRFDISKNLITNNIASLIDVGVESNPNDSNYWYGIISENRVIGNVNPALNQHAIFIYNNDSIDIKYNYVTDALLPIVLKANDVDYSNVHVYGNVIDGRFTLKGCKNSKFYNNTVAIQSGDDFCVNSVLNGSVNSLGNEIRNNILYSNAPDTLTGLGLISVDIGETIISNNNVIYAPNGLHIGQVGGTSYDWIEWQVLGYDINSYNTNPNFKSSTELWPITPSDAIGNGINLGAAFEDGLHISSSWPDNVLTTPQLSQWSIGAYIVPLGKVFIKSNQRVIYHNGKFIYFNN